MSNEVPWLNADEERLWRGWLRLNAQLTLRLMRELQDDAGLSQQDFEVLVNLTDTDEGRVRVSDLATQMLWERSRLSHHLTRMERRGMVQRSECAEDGRGAFIEITPAGRTAIERAAPGHVQAVRRLVFDGLQGEDVETMSGIVGRLLARMDETPGA